MKAGKQEKGLLFHFPPSSRVPANYPFLVMEEPGTGITGFAGAHLFT
jgi:hypothetical protein